MSSDSIGFLLKPQEHDIWNKSRATQNNIFQSNFQVWDCNGLFMLFWANLAFLVQNAPPLVFFFHFRVPQISFRVYVIDSLGMVGICLTESPSILTLPLAKPANRVMACSLGLIDPWITGI